MLNWGTLDRGHFEQLIESLIIRVVQEDSDVVVSAVDGRGGDGGIDVAVRTRTNGSVVRVFQLKHFPQGFSNGFKTVRRRQITDSFNRAMEHSPAEWTLVVPCNLTNEEASFVHSLGANRAGSVSVSVWGRAELDSMLAEHVDLADYAERTPLRTALDRVGRSSATLATTSDLVSEALKLHSGTDAWSSYWRPQVSFENGRPIVHYEALREDSMEREPLHYTFTFDWNGHQSLRDDFDNAMNFGFTKRLELPPDVVTEMRRVGPQWFAGVSGSGTLILGPGKSSGAPGRVTCISTDGRAIASRRATIARTGVGQRGGRADISIAEGIQMNVQMEKDTGAGVVNFSSAIAGLSATAVRDHLQFLQALAASSHLRLTFGSSDSELEISGDHLSPDEGLVMLAEDGAAIEGLASTTFSWPHGYSPSGIERAWIRVVRLMLEGKTTLVPDFREFDIDFSDGAEGIEVMTRDGVPVKFTPGDWTVTMFGEELTVGPITLAHPKMHATRRPGDQEADGPRKLHFAPADGGPLQIWVSERSGSTEPGDIEPWGIPHIRELSSSSV